jgi:hypothetical protein
MGQVAWSMEHGAWGTGHVDLNLKSQRPIQMTKMIGRIFKGV